MPNPDADRWNARYLNRQEAPFDGVRPILLEAIQWLPEPGLALDAAMGLGGNASYLVHLGWSVVGVDVAEVAVRCAKRNSPDLLAVVGDLMNFPIPANKFGAILNLYYLQRDLWPVYEHALKPGGILVFETLLTSMRDIRPEIDPAYLLEPGELGAAFPGLETLVYREGWSVGRSGHRKATAVFVARKPN